MFHTKSCPLLRHNFLIQTIIFNPNLKAGPDSSKVHLVSKFWLNNGLNRKIFELLLLYLGLNLAIWFLWILDSNFVFWVTLNFLNSALCVGIGYILDKYIKRGFFWGQRVLLSLTAAIGYLKCDISGIWSQFYTVFFFQL